MKKQRMFFHVFLLIISVMSFIPAGAFSQQRVVHPYWAPRAWPLMPDDIEQYIEFFKRADEANMPITINLSMTPDVTADHPFFNPVCIDIMKQVRKAVKGY